MSIALSIIIPTLNEKENLERLLKSIKKQDFKDYEIIVADNDSTDGTREIAQKYGCLITKGGLPAKGRNNGAKIAQGDLLLFLDADVALPERAFYKVLSEFKRRKLKISTFFLMPFSKTKISSSRIGFMFLYNIPIFLLEKILPHAAMGILIENQIFKRLKGFNEKITLAEDHDLARRAKKLGKFGILRSTKLYVSDRRFRSGSWLKTYSKFLLCEGYMIFIGPVEKDIFKYSFDHLKEKKK